MPIGDSCAKNLLWKQLQLYIAQNPISVPPGLCVILFLHELLPAEMVAMYFSRFCLIRHTDKTGREVYFKMVVEANFF